MEKAVVKYLSREPHVSQILTGFQMLRNAGLLDVRFEDQSGHYKGTYIEVDYRGKRLIYDVLDGYQLQDEIRELVGSCDYYWKRSFSGEKNRLLEKSSSIINKMKPLGFNYHVSCANHPLDPSYLKEQIKRMMGKEWNNYRSTYFSCKRIEQPPRIHSRKPRVLFMTRLWAGEDEINFQRIQIIRKLNDSAEFDFIGGIPESDISRELAPDLILNGATDRRQYLKIMHSSDICIGSVGLHDSIGWKTGEYIAASKAIINEKFRYEVPGDFSSGIHFFEFETSDECVEIVKYMVRHPDVINDMKIANYQYYLKYLRPDVMIQRTLNSVV